MAGRDRLDVPDPDDWWSASAAQADATTLHRTQAVDGDDWLDDEAADRLGRALRLPLDPRVLAAAVCVLVLLVIGLIASGAFSGGGRPRATTSNAATTTVVHTPSPPAVVVPRSPSGPLAPGASGPQVKLLQRALVTLGFAPGAIDGSYGAATQQALKRFQGAHSLTADGVLGPKTLAALKLALRP